MKSIEELEKELAEANEKKDEKSAAKLVLQMKLAKKRIVNAAAEKVDEYAEELASLERDIEIEDKLAEAYTAGVKPAQILDLTWRGVGRCIARLPQDANWRRFAKKSGILAGELKDDPMLHEELASAVMLVPDGKTFLALARERCPHAPFDLTSAISTAMRSEKNTVGK